MVMEALQKTAGTNVTYYYNPHSSVRERALYISNGESTAMYVKLGQTADTSNAAPDSADFDFVVPASTTLKIDDFTGVYLTVGKANAAVGMVIT